MLGELERVSRAAEAQPQQREVAESDSQLGKEKPLMIGTSPMLQLHRLPTAVDARIRQPEWSIRLAGVEGCRVQPDGNQRVASRDAVGWVIEEEAMQPPFTRVVVLASLLNNRSAGLRWRIAAVAEDLPQIAFPLGAADLDSMHDHLRRLRQDLKTQTERLRMLGGTSGLPSLMRTTVAAQRKEFEAQEKLAERIQQILADAQRLQALLDGHIEVHAQVFDVSKKGSTAVLQFGTPDVVEAQDPADVVPTK